MRHQKLWANRDVVERMCTEGLSLSEMARRLTTNKRHVKAFLVEANIPYVRFRQTGANNPAWKGGRRIDEDGYVLLWMPEHPNADRHGLIREHRLVMEGVIGRYLERDEVVHHIDGNKQNNDPSNLRVYEGNNKHLAETLRGRKNNVSPEGRAILSEKAKRWNAERGPISDETRRKIAEGSRRARQPRVRRPYTMTEEDRQRRQQLCRQLAARRWGSNRAATESDGQPSPSTSAPTPM